MAQQLVLNVDAVADQIRDRGAGARLEIDRATTSAFTTPTALSPVTLVAGQEQYEVFDATGSSGNWYRFRITSSTGLLPSAWSDGFQAGAPRTYASINSLREYIGLPDDSQNNLLSDLLVRATDYLTAQCGRDFFRHPGVSGTEARLFSADGTGYLPIRAGLVSASLVEMATFTGGTYGSLAVTDWVYDPLDKSPSMSYEGLRLSDLGVFDRWYSGFSTVRVTGVFGWETVPTMIEQATADLAREWYRQGPGGGGPVGVNQFGTPIFNAGQPQSVRDAIRVYGYRSWVIA